MSDRHREIRAEELAERVRNGILTKYVDPPIRRTQMALIALSELLAALEAAEEERDEYLADLASEEEAYCRQRDLRKTAEARVEKLETALKWIRGLAQNKLAFHTAFRHIYRRAEEALAASPPPPADKDSE